MYAKASAADSKLQGMKENTDTRMVKNYVLYVDCF